jgi:hypothetical protein
MDIALNIFGAAFIMATVVALSLPLFNRTPIKK